jgi:uncharacterized membrane protein YgaE (UPF0421/DUF939 family)
MNEIDKLTLKLLTSKKKYNCYLETIEPDKSAEINEFYAKVKKYKQPILEMFEKYLEDPESQTANEVDDAIEYCLKSMVKHLEIRTQENKAAKNDYDEQDSSEEEAEEELKKPEKSLWGNKINKRATLMNSLDSFVIKNKKT